MIPAGIRNNNPGNIRHTEIKWVGETSPDAQGFCTFQTPAYGIRALAIDLYNSNVLFRRFSVREITKKYAPPSENNTEAYIASLAKFIGKGPDDRLDLRFHDLAQLYIRGVIIQECGKDPMGNEWYPISQIEYGMQEAGKWDVSSIA